MLFFCISDLALIEPMYQYSLEWYVKLFLLAIEKAPKCDSVDKRLVALKDTFTYVLYENVCRSLFEKDKLLFSFLLTCRIAVGDGRVDAAELQFLLQGSLSMAMRKPKPGETGLFCCQWPCASLQGEPGRVEVPCSSRLSLQGLLSQPQRLRHIPTASSALEPRQWPRARASRRAG